MLFLMTPEPGSEDGLKQQQFSHPPTLSYPQAEEGSYCSQYHSELLVKQTFWTDRPSAYSV